MKSLSHAGLLATPWTAAYQAPLPMGFSRQEYWSGVPLPSPLIYIRTEKQLHCPNILQLILPCNTISRARSLHGIKSMDVINKKRLSDAHIQTLLVTIDECQEISSEKAMAMVKAMVLELYFSKAFIIGIHIGIFLDKMMWCLAWGNRNKTLAMSC